MGTRKQVAERAGVSEATVSRVFNGVTPMKESTKQRVLEAAAALGYTPNVIAQRFAKGRSGNLGVVLPYVPKVHLFSTYYFSEILSGIGETVRELGYDLLLLFRSPGEETDYASLYRSGKVDACIMLGSSDDANEIQALQELEEQGYPFCLVNQHYAGRQWCEVDADHIRGSYDAVKHLLHGGCRRIAFVNGPELYSNSRDRLQGYWNAMTEAGIPVEESLLFEGNYSRKSGYAAASRIYERRSSIDAVFAANDRMAIGLMQGLRELGLRPGVDLPIVGYDDSDASRLTDPLLTTVHVPFFEMGRRAASQLLELLSNQADGHETAPFQEKLETHLVVRGTSL
ncbi:LacI family DNA-binding transcriptional regulator [Paenibacillus koleovorans]|uniref:LacI family DNA-binding transcriptional regulator n=1 Tax=Paenibacillus koleovorans TaxID=121608 RepID=UPI000FDA954B|nr:LacI family DNA-binding transcriptional regulator [Paenibacillus koleovorans]